MRCPRLKFRPAAVLVVIMFMTTGCGGGSDEPRAPATGMAALQECAQCHPMSEGLPHRLGPNLVGVFGQPAGVYEDFAYSRALRASDVVWDVATLDAYLENPQKVIPGGRMAYRGESDPERRAILVDAMRMLGPAESLDANDPPATP